MTGNAQTNEFVLSMGTVMVGPSDETMELNPTDHSIGLVKNVNITVDPQFVELTQGVDEQVVASVNTRNQARVSAEVYEFTARNLAYANGLNATGASYDANDDTLTLATTIDGVAEETEIELGAGQGSSVAIGDFLVLQSGVGSDNVHVAKIGSIATDTVTVAAGYEIPIGQVFTAGTAKVYKVHDLPVGGGREDTTFGVKIVGLMSKTGEPITMIFPKVKVTNGLGIQLTNSDFSNMPFEFMPYALLPGDPFYADFPGQQGKILKR